MRKLKQLLIAEEELFRKQHPRSLQLFIKASECLLGGVPMSWMKKWAGGFPLFFRSANGAHLEDEDGINYIDFCLGDTGAMPGHSPEKVREAVAAQVARGITTMLPSEESIRVGEELKKRFGLDFWQFTVTATDANRFAIRIARQITGRKRILVFNYCYHGSVDEALITLKDGVSHARQGNVGPPVDPSVTTIVIEFNDVEALQHALAGHDIACVLAEPAMTNIGIIHPDPDFHRALRLITQETGTLLILDETHTLCTGPGGYTAAHGLRPDILTVGKAIGSGVPAATYGVTAEIAQRILSEKDADYEDTGGIGGTLAGNALSITAIRATLENVWTDAAFVRTIPLTKRFVAGVSSIIQEFRLPWHVSELGCRAEYRFRPDPPRNGTQAAAASDTDLDQYMHLFALNRGILMTPFHNMALISPETCEADIDHHTGVFRDAVRSLLD